MIILEFPFTFADRLKAAMVVMSTSVGAMIWALIFPLMGIALPIVAHVTGARFATSDALLSLLLIAFPPALLLWSVWRGHRAFADTPIHVYTISTEGIRSRSAHAELMQDWTRIRAVRIRRGYLLLYFASNCAHCIPLRHVDPAQLQEIGSLARGAGVARVTV